jgi:hypothetical protein
MPRPIIRCMGFIYPMAGATDLLPWPAAREGELFYSRKVLQAIEKVIQGWVVWNTTNNRLTVSGDRWPRPRMTSPEIPT